MPSSSRARTRAPTGVDETKHDSAYPIRQALWLAYALCALLLVLLVAVVLIRQPSPFALRAPAASHTPTARGRAVSPAPGVGSPTGAGSGNTATGSLTRTGSRPGEPPGDIEDDT